MNGSKDERPGAMRMALSGRVTLLTGSGGGIGRVLARGFAEAGARVALHDRRAQLLADAERLLHEADLPSRSFVADLASVDPCPGLIAEVDQETFESIVAVNIRAPYFLSQPVQPVMAGQGGGRIINIGSLNNFYGLHGVSVDGQTKAAITQLTKSCAVAWAPDNIQVYCLTPGFIVTPMNEESLWGVRRSAAECSIGCWLDGWAIRRISSGRSLPSLGRSCVHHLPDARRRRGLPRRGSWEYQVRSGQRSPAKAGTGPRRKRAQGMEATMGDEVIRAPFESGDDAWLARLRPERLFSLVGRVAIVTGGAGGIGRWLCAGLGLAGATVVVTDRERESIEEAVTWLRGMGVEALALAVDLEDEDAAERIINGALERTGQLDILVNNAGINRRIPMLEVTTELLEHIWKVDYIRCYELSQAAARVMIKQGVGGSVIHISSLNNQIGLEDVSLLGPTKAALSQLAKVMTIEFAGHGIRTNALAPGFIATPMNETHWTHETRAPWIFDRTPMSRPGHPAELVGTALLLASDAGSFISGQTIYVDGGFLSGSRWNVPPGTGLTEYRAWLAAGRRMKPPAPAGTQNKPSI